MRIRVRGYGNLLHYPAIALPTLADENASDKKSIVHTLSLKKDFLVGYIYEKGAMSFGRIAEGKKQ